MAEAGGIIGCLLLVGCCGACFMCGRGCKSDNNVREPVQQPTRIVVTPVAVSPTVVQPTAPALPTAPTVMTVPAGYIVMTDPTTGEQRLYAPVTQTASSPAANAQATTETQPTTSTQDDLQTPLLKD